MVNMGKKYGTYRYDYDFSFCNLIVLPNFAMPIAYIIYLKKYFSNVFMILPLSQMQTLILKYENPPHKSKKKKIMKMLTKSKPFQQILCENNLFKSSTKIFKSQGPTTPAPKADKNMPENITNRATICRRQLVKIGNKNCFKVLRKINYVNISMSLTITLICGLL